VSSLLAASRPATLCRFARYVHAGRGDGPIVAVRRPHIAIRVAERPTRRQDGDCHRKDDLMRKRRSNHLPPRTPTRLPILSLFSMESNSDTAKLVCPVCGSDSIVPRRAERFKGASGKYSTLVLTLTCTEEH